MSERLGISLEEIRDFMLANGGKVTNHELVKHFKDALTNQKTRDKARILFKELVNTVATITRDSDGNKQLILKKKYQTVGGGHAAATSSTGKHENQGGYSTGTVPPALSMSPDALLNLRYTPVYQTSSSHDSSSIGDSSCLGSPLSLKGSPSFTSDSTYPSTSYSRRPSQDSLLSQLSLRTAPSTASSPTLTSRTSSTSSASSTSGTVVNSANSASSNYTSSGTSSSSSSSSTSAITGRSTPHLQRQTSNESMYSTFSEFGPPTPTSPIHPILKDSFDPPPPVPPRRKSSDKIKLELRENLDEQMKSSLSGSRVATPDMATSSPFTTPVPSPDLDNKENVANVSKISVKERRQKFDRMASESALNKSAGPNNGSGNLITKKKHDKTDKDEEDSGSVQLLDAKSREWLVRCAQGDYQAIVKLATENPKLVRFKDPASGYTSLHWGAKHGNLDIIKFIAGTHKADVNSRTNGGYTALHLATQFGHEEACTLLVKVYKADENLRDYSGRKPRQYQKTSDTSISADTFRKIKARKKHAAEKDLGFLRIGSLNVRVKRTTEAFSNFLGVGNTEKLHKHWGSADNLSQADNKRMPPPKFAPIKKRKSKRGQDFSSHKTAPPVIEQHPVLTAQISSLQNPQDSDSDTAAGFGSNWQSTV